MIFTNSTAALESFRATPVPAAWRRPSPDTCEGDFVVAGFGEQGHGSREILNDPFASRVKRAEIGASRSCHRRRRPAERESRPELRRGLHPLLRDNSRPIARNRPLTLRACLLKELECACGVAGDSVSLLEH